METLRWLRIVGDTIFIIGTGAFAYFMLGLWTGWSYEREAASAPATLRGSVPTLRK
jgi:nitric oxide reductase subunit B